MNNTNTATISSHYQEQDNNNNNNNSNIINYYYYLDTEPGVSEKVPDLIHQEALDILHQSRDDIIQCYEYSLGIPLNNTVANMFVQFIEQGHRVYQLIDAIQRTAFAPRPSPAYLRTVLNNYDSKMLRNERKPRQLIF